MIVGDRVRTQPLALEAGVACLIVDRRASRRARRGRERAEPEMPRSSSPARHLRGGAPRLARARRGRPHGHRRARPRARHAALRGGRGPPRVAHREAVVVDERRVRSASSRAPISRAEVAVEWCSSTTTRSPQSAAGIEDASVVEIVDHHRVGDIQSARPDPVPEPAGRLDSDDRRDALRGPRRRDTRAARRHPARGGADRHRAAEVADHDRRRSGGR